MKLAINGAGIAGPTREQPMSKLSDAVEAGHPVVCPHCHGDRFDARQTLLNTTMLTAIGLDWLDRMSCRSAWRTAQPRAGT